VAFAGAVLGGIKGFMAANKAVKGRTQGADDVLKFTENTVTKAWNCFVTGTEILTVDGIKNIEDIVVGDWVIADDPTTPGGIEAKQVLETFVRETDALVDLYVDGEVISTTGEHPFWVADKGWVEAKDLAVGSLLQTGDGRIVDVDRVEKREGKFEVYNFRVEGIPTYFVSELGVLVHNANYPGTANNLPRLKGKPENQIRDILQKEGFTQTKVSNSPARNETWDHPDGSQVRIHPYGNQKVSPYKTGNNAHIHKQDPAGNQLNDRGIPSTNPAETHIGIPNPPDLSQIRNRPHGA
jgi:hypothetical protein